MPGSCTVVAESVCTGQISNPPLFNDLTTGGLETRADPCTAPQSWQVREFSGQLYVWGRLSGRTLRCAPTTSCHRFDPQTVLPQSQRENPCPIAPPNLEQDLSVLFRGGNLLVETGDIGNRSPIDFNDHVSYLDSCSPGQAVGR